MADENQESDKQQNTGQSDLLLQDALDYANNIIATLRHPFLVLDADLRVKSANRAFYTTFQVGPDETEGQRLYELGNSQWDIPQLRRLLEEILPKNEVLDDYEVAHDFPVIGPKFMLLNARRMYRQPNHSELILLAIEDITERRRADEKRQEIETRFTSLVKNVKDHAIFTLDLAGHITSWNVAAERILGYSEREALGQPFSIIFTPEDVEQGIPERELRLAKKNGRAEDERWHKRKNGEQFWALGIITPTRDARGQHAGFSKILRDMAERKRAEEALQESDRRKNEFLAMLAHELRNPLAPIFTAIQLIGQNGGDDAVQREARTIIERQVRTWRD